MKLTAKAKVNLRLKCVGKYENGYHELEMINRKINLCDYIDISTSNNNELIYMNSNLNPKKDSLVIDIVEYFQTNFKIKDNFKVVIEKHIPVGAGLGGGSSDAACVMNYLNNIYKLGLSKKQLIEIGKKYGADIPYCLFDEDAIVRKTGEDITITDIKINDDMFVIYPNISISTIEVFKNNTKFSSKSDLTNIKNIYNYLDNDLEEACLKVCPDIIDVRKYLNSFPHKGLVMSGSGSTYIMFSDKQKSKYIYNELLKNKKWYIYKEEC